MDPVDPPAPQEMLRIALYLYVPQILRDAATVLRSYVEGKVSRWRNRAQNDTRCYV